MLAKTEIDVDTIVTYIVYRNPLGACSEPMLSACTPGMSSAKDEVSSVETSQGVSSSALASILGSSGSSELGEVAQFVIDHGMPDGWACGGGGGGSGATVRGRCWDPRDPASELEYRLYNIPNWIVVLRRALARPSRH